MKARMLTTLGVLALGFATVTIAPEPASACPGEPKKPSLDCPGEPKKPSLDCPGEPKKPSLDCPGEPKKPSAR